jgi:hypothetical protein
MLAPPSVDQELLAFQCAIFLVRYNPSSFGYSVDFRDESLESTLNSLPSYGDTRGDLRLYGKALHHSIGLFNKYFNRSAIKVSFHYMAIPSALYLGVNMGAHVVDIL